MSAGRLGCGGNPSGPTEPLTYYGIPNATAFENLGLVRTLERTSGRSTVLVVIKSTYVGQNGGLTARGIWTYGFWGDGTTLHVWEVLATGQAKYLEPVPYLNLGITEMGPFLAIDSPQAIRLGLENGARAFVDRYPGGDVSMSCRFLGGRAFWEMFFNQPTPGCRLGPIVIDATTGQLLYRDLYCLTRGP